MYSHSLFPYISKPSRVTTRSATLIDNIFCNDILENTEVFTGILYSDVSDHFPVFYIDHTTSTMTEHKFIKKRSFQQRNLTHFCTMASQNDWSNILNCTDAQVAYTYFF